MPSITVSEMLVRLQNDRRFMENVTALKRIPAQEGSFASFPSWVQPSIVTALRKRGIERLYSHQAEAADLIRRGRDVVLVTPTASGKTLCYNLPVLQRILEEPETARSISFRQRHLPRTRCTKYTASSRSSGRT